MLPIFNFLFFFFVFTRQYDNDMRPTMVSVSIIPMINAIIVRREESMLPLPCDVFTIGVFARGGKVALSYIKVMIS